MRSRSLQSRLRRAAIPSARGFKIALELTLRNGRRWPRGVEPDRFIHDTSLLRELGCSGFFAALASSGK